MSIPEPRIVIAHREHLWQLLSEALQLEHMIMCQYLFAQFSLKDGARDGLTADQADAVDRWRTMVRGIAVEEMLHMALVANLMSAIGAAPYFGRPNFPQRSGYFPAGVQLDLLPFGEAALHHFLFLERPEGIRRDDSSEFVETASARDPVDPRETLPRGQEYATIGHLYRGIAHGLRNLSSRLGERAVFVGSARAQATPEFFRWPQLVSVTDLDSALVAIQKIIEQGEGAPGDSETGHYGRFLSIRHEFDAMRRADPTFEPARPALAAFLRQPFDIPTAQHLIGDADTPDRGAGRTDVRAHSGCAVAVLHAHRREQRAAPCAHGRRAGSDGKSPGAAWHRAHDSAGRPVPPRPHRRFRFRDALRDGQHDPSPRAGVGATR
jgi:hypothetical protein